MRVGAAVHAEVDVAVLVDDDAAVGGAEVLAALGDLAPVGDALVGVVARAGADELRDRQRASGGRTAGAAVLVAGVGDGGQGECQRDQKQRQRHDGSGEVPHPDFSLQSGPERKVRRTVLPCPALCGEHAPPACQCGLAGFTRPKGFRM